MVKNPPPSAGDAGSIPGQGTKIPHAAGQLNPPAAIREKPPKKSLCSQNKQTNKKVNKLGIVRN